MEYRIPVDDMEDLTEVENDKVPENPYRMQGVVGVENTALDDVVEADVITEPEFEAIVETGQISDVTESTVDEMVVRLESDLGQDAIREHKERDLPSNKADYLRMSIAEKVCCFPFDTKGTDSAFEMLKAYFETVGLSTDFNSIFEEAKLLTNYYEEQIEQIIEKIDMMGIDTEKFSQYPVDVLSKAFNFGDMKYFAEMKMLNQIFDRLGVNMAHQERYELFDRMYEEGVREKIYEKNRNSR